MGIEEKMRARGGAVPLLFEAAFAASLRRAEGRSRAADAISLAVARSIIFPAIRSKLGADLRALICGSAPLSRDTQIFFEMLGIPVLQVYGLTETTAICTMDHPRRAKAGRVGEAIEDVEMKLSLDGEIRCEDPMSLRDIGIARRPTRPCSWMVGFALATAATSMRTAGGELPDG